MENHEKRNIYETINLIESNLTQMLIHLETLYGLIGEKNIKLILLKEQVNDTVFFNNQYRYKDKQEERRNKIKNSAFYNDRNAERKRKEEESQLERERYDQRYAKEQMREAMGSDYDENGFGTYP